MMARDWQPGDVALVKQLGGTERLAIVGKYSRNAALSPPHFVYVSGGYDDVRGKANDARPLVLIDPESADDAERLVRLFWANGNDDCDDMAAMRAALREFADPTPPKPDEPTGLGAVVVDVEGIRWTRVEAGHAKTRNPWYPADAADFQPDEWDNLCAVEVLSEGVTP